MLLAAEHFGPTWDRRLSRVPLMGPPLAPAEGWVTQEAVMTRSTAAVLVHCDDADCFGERSMVAAFLAGYASSTRVCYATDLRLFAAWCAGNGVRLLELRHTRPTSSVGVA
jgi:hypothetical protein